MKDHLSIMGFTMIAVSAICVAAAGGPQEAQNSEPGKWVKLFNGKDVKDWLQLGGKAVYTVEESAITGTTVPKTENTFLCPPKKYGDFELTLEVNCDPELNSGVQIRSYNSKASLPESLDEGKIERAERRFATGSLCGPQVEIAANGGAGGVYFEGVGGWILEPKKDLANKAYTAGEWNSYRILARGKNVKVWINDTLINDGDIAEAGVKAGYLGFQVHGVGGRTEPLQVRWRNIKIRELD